jgi:PAS domain S-box-containing protein
MKKKGDEKRKNNKELHNSAETRDITGHRKTEDELRKSERFFKEVTENSSDIIIITDENGNIKYCSPSMERFAGYKPEEVTGKNAFTFIHPDEVKRATDEYGEAILKKDSPLPQNLFRIMHKDGSVRFFAGTGKILLDNPDIAGVIMNVHDITEHKKAEGLLKQSEARYRLLADNVTDAIFTMDMNFNYTYATPSSYNIVGYTADEFMTMRVEKLVDSKTLSWFAEMFAEELEIEKRPDRDLKRSRVLEYQHIHKDGSKVWVENKITFLRDKNDTAIGVVGVVRDITERKAAEESALKEYNFSRLALDSLTVPFFMFDATNRNFFRWNKAFAFVSGYSDEEIAHMRPADLIPKSEQGRLLSMLEEFRKKGLVSFEVSVVSKDGASTPYLLSGNLLHYDGKPYVVGMGIDITERKRVEGSLKQSEEKYRLLADHMKDQVWIMDMNLKVSYVSPSVEKLFGYTFDELKELSLDKILTSESLQKAMDFFSKEMPTALAAPSNYTLTRSLELEFCCKDGRTLWAENKFSFIRDEKGNPVSILGEGRNITERKQVEDALRKSEENFRRSLDDSPLGVRISTLEGKTIYANRTILDIYGYDNVEELENTPLPERYTPETYAEFKTRKKKRLRGEPGPSEYEVSIVRKNGEIRNLYVFRKEIFWSGKKQSQVIYQDITLRRQAEEKLSQILENLRQSIKITIQVLGMAAEARDPYMAGHQKRVADLARAIATEMKLPHDKIEAIRMAGAIHDIGKISVPSEILCKPSILSDLEFSFIKNHPQFSYDIIKEVESPWPLADIVHQHHERIDGSGYPLGLKNEDILIESRILAVADVVEAMISYRPYRPALELDIALAEIENNAGILYDRKASEACLKLFREKGYHISA